jgi:predicted amidohydrolase YtcJ
MENAISREDALRAMTIWAAKASFDENQKGSIEQDKRADFVVLDRDIMTAEEHNIPDTKIIHTYIDGKKMAF